MYEDESRSGQRRARQEDQFEDALQLGPRKKPYVSLTSPGPVKLYGCIADQLCLRSTHTSWTALWPNTPRIM